MITNHDTKAAAALPDIAIKLHDRRLPGTASAAAQGILVVDDEASLLALTCLSLAKVGFAVQKTTDGKSALEMITDDPTIDLLVTDFAMPGMSGGKLISLATKIRPGLKALVMTGYQATGGLAELPPGTQIIAKPFRRDEFVAKVRALLGELRPVSVAV